MTSLGGPIVRSAVVLYANRDGATLSRRATTRISRKARRFIRRISRAGLFGQAERFRQRPLTWQATPKQVQLRGHQNDCSAHRRWQRRRLGSAQSFRFKPAILAQITWTAPPPSKVLIEAGVTLHVCVGPFRRPNPRRRDISIWSCPPDTVTTSGAFPLNR